MAYLLIVIIFLFLFGLVVGSFLNVVIYRSVHGEDFVKGRSRCDHCKKQIAWYDNIPLISYILLAGRCRYCKKPISRQHPAIELLTGLLFVWWYVIGSTFFQLTQEPAGVIQKLFWLAVGILLLIIFATDWLYQIIPDYASYALAILSFTYRLTLSVLGIMRWEDFWLSIASGIGLMLFIGALWFFTKGRGMGFGDVKYALGMGWLLGWPRALVGVFLAFILGAIIGVLFIALRLKKVKDKIAFGPFLVLGTAIALIWGNAIWNWYFALFT